MKGKMDERDVLRLVRYAIQADKGDRCTRRGFVAVLDCPFCEEEHVVTVRRDGRCRCFGSCPTSHKFHELRTLLKEFGFEVPDFGDIPDPVAGQSLFPTRKHRRSGVTPTGQRVVLVP